MIKKTANDEKFDTIWEVRQVWVGDIGWKDQNRCEARQMLNKSKMDENFIIDKKIDKG